MQHFGILTKKVESSSSTSDTEQNNGSKCKNYKTCKGKGNTNRYKNLSSHRKETFCPLEKNKVIQKIKRSIFSKKKTFLLYTLIFLENKPCF